MKKIKKNNKGKSKVWSQVELVVLLTFLLLIIYHSMQLVYSIHSIDLAYNIQYITSAINGAGFSRGNQTLSIPFESITDTGSDYVERPLKDYYISAMNGLKKYFLYSLFDMMVLGLLLARRLK